VFTSDTNFGSHVYCFVTSKTANGFTIVLNASNGNPQNAPASTTVDWVALPVN
jgi:heme-binding NEAT domain protein